MLKKKINILFFFKKQITIPVICFIVFFFFMHGISLLLSAQNKNETDWNNKIEKATSDSSKLSLLIFAARDMIKYYPATSKKYASDAILIATRLNKKKEIADGFALLGQVEFIKGNYPLSLDHLLKASTIYQETTNKKGLADTYNLLSKVYHFLGPDYFMVAEKYNHSALIFQQAMNDKEGMVNSYTNLGELFSDNISISYFRPDSALFFLNKALNIAGKLNDEYSLANIYNIIGNTYKSLGKYDSAFKNLNKSLKIYNKINDNKGITISYYRLSSIYNRLGKYNLAISYNLKALKWAEENRNLDLINNICEDLSDSYAKLNDYKKAYAYYKKSVETKFQLYTQERIAKIADYQTKYETVKKEKEIILLNKDKEIQRVELQKKESEIKKQQIIQIAFLGGFILVLILAIVAYRGYQNKKNANSLLGKQKTEILEKNAILFQQKEEITTQRDEIEKKNVILKQAYDTIENKSNKITSSINYALKIQQSILPTEEKKTKLFPDSFVLFLPKDIVSGDFYWLDERDNKIFFAVVDCTGHGVPGAFMSMIASNLLDRALSEQHLTRPSEILNYINNKLIEKLHSNIDDDSLRDGLDIAICTYQKDTMIIEYTGVHHPLYIIRNNNLIIIKPDKFSIGNKLSDSLNTFTNQTVKIEKNDMIYLFTDGYYDQFNDRNDDKFTRKRFNETLLKLSAKPLYVQHTELISIFENWKGTNEQIDDILVIGIRI